MLLGANTEESSKRDYGIADRPADLVDHEPLDAAQIVALWVVYSCSFNAVTFDQGLTSPVSRSSSRSCTCERYWWGFRNPANTAGKPSAMSEKEFEQIKCPDRLTN